MLFGKISLPEAGSRDNFNIALCSIYITLFSSVTASLLVMIAANFSVDFTLSFLFLFILTSVPGKPRFRVVTESLLAWFAFDFAISVSQTPL